MPFAANAYSHLLKSSLGQKTNLSSSIKSSALVLTTSAHGDYRGGPRGGAVVEEDVMPIEFVLEANLVVELTRNMVFVMVRFLMRHILGVNMDNLTIC